MSHINEVEGRAADLIGSNVLLDEIADQKSEASWRTRPTEKGLQYQISMKIISDLIEWTRKCFHSGIKHRPGQEKTKMIKNQIHHQSQEVQDHQSTQANLGSPAHN